MGNAVTWETESHTEGAITQHLYYMYTHDAHAIDFGAIDNNGVANVKPFLHVNQELNGFRNYGSAFFARWFCLMNFESAPGVIHNVLVNETRANFTPTTGKALYLPLNTGPGALASRPDFIFQNTHWRGAGLLGNGRAWGVAQPSMPTGFTPTGNIRRNRDHGAIRPGDSMSHDVIVTAGNAYVQPGPVGLCGVVTGQRFVNAQSLGRLANPAASNTLIQIFDGASQTSIRQCPITQNVAAHVVYSVARGDPNGPAAFIPGFCTVTVRDESGTLLWGNTDAIFTQYTSLASNNDEFVVRHVGNLGGGNIYIADGNGLITISRQWFNTLGNPFSPIEKLFCSVADPAVVNPQPPAYDVGTVPDMALLGGYVASW